MNLSKKLQFVSKEIYAQHDKYIKENFLDRVRTDIRNGIEIYRDVISKQVIMVAIEKNDRSIEYYSRVQL